MRMAYLHDPDGSPVLVNPAHVVVVAPLDEGGCGLGDSTGKITKIREYFDEVQGELNAALCQTDA